jgi:hypothetical protein
MVALQQGSDANAHHDLQAEKGEATAKHPCSQAAGALSRSSLLRPKPLKTPSESVATDSQQPAHQHLPDKEVRILGMELHTLPLLCLLSTPLRRLPRLWLLAREASL